MEARIAAALTQLRAAYSLSVRKLRRHMLDLELDLSGGSSLDMDSVSEHQADDQSLSEQATEMVAPAALENGTVDMWLSIRAYKSAVVELSHVIQLLHIRESKLRDMKRNVRQSLKVLFVATMQLFVHERSRICSESAEFLQRKKSEVLRMKLGSSDPNPCASPLTETAEQTSSASVKAEEGGAETVQMQMPVESSASAVLPTGNGQILMQSIMQITTLENAHRIQAQGKDKPPERRGSSSFLGGMLGGAAEDSKMSDLMSAKVVVTADGLLHVFLLEGAHQSSSKDKTSDKPYKSLLLEVRGVRSLTHAVSCLHRMI